MEKTDYKNRLNKDKDKYSLKQMTKRNSELTLTLRKSHLNSHMNNVRKEKLTVFDESNILAIRMNQVENSIPEDFNVHFNSSDRQLEIINEFISLDFTSIINIGYYTEENKISFIYFALNELNEMVYKSDEIDLYKEENAELLNSIFHNIISLIDKMKDNPVIVYNSLNVLIGLSCDVFGITNSILSEENIINTLNQFENSTYIGIHSNIIWLYHNCIAQQQNNALYLFQNSKILISFLKVFEYMNANICNQKKEMSWNDCATAFNLLKALIESIP